MVCCIKVKTGWEENNSSCFILPEKRIQLIELQSKPVSFEESMFRSKI